MQRIFKTSLTLIILVLVTPVLSWAWQGKVVRVTDGDTLTVTRGSKREGVRFFGIDCPARNQDFGQRARQFTFESVFGKEVSVEPVTKDRHGYTMAIIKVGDVVLNRKLIESGLAWVDLKFCYRKECHEWTQLQDQAQRAKIGLWSEPGPIPPWEFKGQSRKALRSHPQTKNRELTAKPIEIYHGDVVSHVFHAPGCEEFNCKSCIAVFKNKEAALRAGYKPCPECLPQN